MNSSVFIRTRATAIHAAGYSVAAAILDDKALDAQADTNGAVRFSVTPTGA